MKRKLFKKSIVAGILMMMLAPTSAVFAQSPFFEQQDFYEARTLVGGKEPLWLNGNLSEAKFHQPSSIVQLSDGSFLIADTLNHTIRVMNLEQEQVDSYAGIIVEFDDFNEAVGAYYDGDTETSAFHAPSGLAVDHENNVYVADAENHVIRKISSDGTVTTVAGSAVLGHSDGKGTEAQFYYPNDVVVDSKGNIYVADTLNHAIRKIAKDGRVTTLNALSDRVVEHPQGNPEFTGDFADGKLSTAKFNEPTNIIVDSKDNLYVADRGNQRIRYIDFATNEVRTVAGSGELKDNQFYVAEGFKDGKAHLAQFNSPEGMALVNDDILIVADRKNHVIRAIEKGVVRTIAGKAEEFGDINGVLPFITFNEPSDVLVTDDGKMFVVEAGYHRIRVISSYLAYSDLTSANELQVLVNGKLIQLEENPYIDEGSIFISLSAVGEALGLKVTQRQPQQIMLSKDHKQYVFDLNTSEVTISENGEQLTLSVDNSIQIKNNVSFVPLRFIAEQLGYHVAWDKNMKNVVIRDKSYE